jgi:hypothetical protein
MTMRILSRFGASVTDRRLLWAPIYSARLEIFEPTGIIIPLGDTQSEAGDLTTVTTRGDQQVVFTYSEARDGFDTGLTSTGPARIPVVTFNGTDENASSADAAFWSHAGTPFSVGAWVYMRDSTNSCIMSKYDNAGDEREWIMAWGSSDTLRLELADESVGFNPTILTTANAATAEGVWVYVVATYDGSADASGINLYTNGALVASTDSDNANFVNLEDRDAVLALGYFNATPSNLFDGKMAGGPLGPFHVSQELTADEILQDYQLCREALGV